VSLTDATGGERPEANPRFAEEEVRKSNLLLEAQLLRAEHRTEEAAIRFAQAADIEQRLSELCRTQGLQTDAWMHRFSAAGCWAQAGNFHEAITLGDELLAEADLPSAFRQRVQEYTATLRRRREQWSAGLAFTTTGVE
jgi:hypothetical protein